MEHLIHLLCSWIPDRFTRTYQGTWYLAEGIPGTLLSPSILESNFSALQQADFGLRTLGLLAAFSVVQVPTLYDSYLQAGVVLIVGRAVLEVGATTKSSEGRRTIAIVLSSTWQTGACCRDGLVGGLLLRWR